MMQIKHRPSKATLTEVCPTILDKLPSNYKGNSTSSHLAYAFGKALETKTYNEIVEANPELPTFMDTPGSKEYADKVLRFGINQNTLTAYYDVLSVYGKADLENDEVNFAVSLASRFEGGTLTGVIAIFSAIYLYQKDYLGRKKNDIVLPTIKDFENINTLSNLLRSEGIIMPNANLWVASSHWKTSEIFHMLEEGLQLDKAMELYLLGFTTMEEIINFGEILPEAWINRILNGPPKVEETLL